MTLSLRRTVSNGWGYDFNYTWSHAIDNGGGSESALDPVDGTYSGPQNIQNAFCFKCGMASSDYDARHAINANAVIELPVGKGKAFFSNAPKLVDGIIGGWQVSTLFNFHTGNPVQCIASYQYNTNYDRESLCHACTGR